MQEPVDSNDVLAYAGNSVQTLARLNSKVHKDRCHTGC